MPSAAPTYVHRSAEANSEVPPPPELLDHLGPRELVDGEPLPAGRAECTAGAGGDPENRLALPATSLQLLDRAVEVGHPVDEDGLLTLEVVGQQQRGWLVAQ